MREQYQSILQYQQGKHALDAAQWLWAGPLQLDGTWWGSGIHLVQLTHSSSSTSRCWRSVLELLLVQCWKSVSSAFFCRRTCQCQWCVCTGTLGVFLCFPTTVRPCVLEQADAVYSEAKTNIWLNDSNSWTDSQSVWQEWQHVFPKREGCYLQQLQLTVTLTAAD